MAGNSIGQLFKVTTFGESHGPALGAIIDGCPPGLEISEADIQIYLNRRRPGQSRYTSQRKEPDQIQILSGVFLGKTTGTPIGLQIINEDQKSKDYENIAEKFRPGHADYTYWKKYGIRDYRGGGRSSARETAMRVAAGAIAQKYLFEKFGIVIRACLTQLGDIHVEEKNWEIVNENPFFCPDANKIPLMEKRIQELLKEGDSIGAKIYVEAMNVPAGWGEPVFDRFDADLAHALMSINAVKAVGIGAGFACVAQKGSEHRDAMSQQGFLSNHSGGVLGGITSGQTIYAEMALKPTSSIRLPVQTLNISGEEVEIVTHGRHDPCVGIRAAPIAEAMMAIVLMDHCMRHRAQNLF